MGAWTGGEVEQRGDRGTRPEVETSGIAGVEHESCSPAIHLPGFLFVSERRGK